MQDDSVFCARIGHLLRVSIGLVLATGCLTLDPETETPTLSRATFDSAVYPVLARDCGFPACHGNRDRFFRVFAPGRVRLTEETGVFAAPTEQELALSFTRAQSMAEPNPIPERALLLQKPLDVGAGGAAHGGLDALGRDVYTDVDDPALAILRNWVTGGGGP